MLLGVAESDASVRAVVFVDDQGEAVDYWSSVEPFDAKVVAAQMVAVLRTTEARFAARGLGTCGELVVTTDAHQVVVTWVSHDYFLVVLRGPEDMPPLLRSAIEEARVTLRRDAALAAPTWERPARIVDVETRASTTWGYAPARYRERGESVAVEHVLGRWEWDGQVCFRVRTDDGRELTLAHDPAEALWTVLLREG